MSLSLSLGEEIANSILPSHLETDFTKWTRTMDMNKDNVCRQIIASHHPSQANCQSDESQACSCHNVIYRDMCYLHYAKTNQHIASANEQTPKRLLHTTTACQSSSNMRSRTREAFWHKTQIPSKTCQKDLSSCQRSNAVLHNLPNPNPQ